MGQEKLPVLTTKQIISVLERLGFRHRPLTATSHRRYVHPDGRRTTVRVHPGQDMGRGLLRKILRDIEMSSEEFGNFL
jgi:predicted RNA binding protein YcfA (HicA-like mRNA interferase family)